MESAAVSLKRPMFPTPIPPPAPPPAIGHPHPKATSHQQLVILIQRQLAFSDACTIVLHVYFCSYYSWFIFHLYPSYFTTRNHCFFFLPTRNPFFVVGFAVPGWPWYCLPFLSSITFLLSSGLGCRNGELQAMSLRSQSPGLVPQQGRLWGSLCLEGLEAARKIQTEIRSQICHGESPGYRPGHPGHGSTRRVDQVWPGRCIGRSFDKPEPVQPSGRPGPGLTRRAGLGLITMIWTSISPMKP